MTRTLQHSSFCRYFHLLLLSFCHGGVVSSVSGRAQASSSWTNLSHRLKVEKFSFLTTLSGCLSLLIGHAVWFDFSRTKVYIHAFQKSEYILSR